MGLGRPGARVRFRSEAGRGSTLFSGILLDYDIQHLLLAQMGEILSWVVVLKIAFLLRRRGLRLRVRVVCGGV